MPNMTNMMVQKVLYGFMMFLSIGMVLFLNGNIQLTKDPIPPLGKFLNPFGGVWTSDTRNEKKEITLTDHLLKDEVKIIYDDRRVPHIFANNIEDALFAQGYVEAHNRLFQMEFLALAAAGELSSIIGSKTIQIDLEKRRRGMKYAAENAVKGWERQPDYKTAYRYVDGVNAYINSLDEKDLPIEFKLFDLEPTPWTPLKTALVFKQMSLTLAGRNDDVEMTNLLVHLGKKDFDMLYPEHQDIENPVIPTEKPYQFDTLYGLKQDTAAYYKQAILNKYFANRNKGIGSNSWGVSGQKTATGHPIFCNDPHLSLGLPSIWIEEHIHTPEFNAYGVSFPGFPGIMIGFNENIAWGETNVGQDVEDIFMIKWTDQSKTKYLLDGKEVPCTLRIEEVRVKGGKSIIDTVRYTNWGPVFKSSDDGKHDLAMRWLCHDVPDTDEYNVFIDAMKCKNYNDYLMATGDYISPAQNFGFACRDGDIAMRVNGRFPAKYGQDGRFVEYGNQSSNNWQAWIPRHQNPQIINPKRGFIASANQVSADKTYPYYFTGKFERYRNRSVNEKLNQMNDITPEQMQKMQQDAYSHKAADYITTIKTMDVQKSVAPSVMPYLTSLMTWDFQYKAESAAPTYFDVFYKKLSENTWDELLILKKEMDVNMPEAWRLLELIQKEPNNKYFDINSTPKIENARDIVLKSLTDMASELDKISKDAKDLSWGSYKPLHIYHLTRIPAFSVMDLPANGCPDAINATGYSFGPSWRMVISLEDKVNGHAVYPGGQSGNPTSKYYKNMVAAWLKGEYFPLNIHTNVNDLNKSKTQSITIKPKK